MEISTIEELLKYLYLLELKKGTYCFRGEADYNWKLIPSIHREKTGYKRYQTVVLESAMLGHLKKRNLPHIYTKHPVEILMMCQHYDFYTRLLDWSNDVLVALYFACYDKTDIDGSLYILNKDAYDKYDFGSPEDIQKHPAPLIIDTHIINPRMRAQSGCFLFWSTHPLDDNSTESYDLLRYNNKNESKFIDKKISNPLIKIRIPKNNKKKILKDLDNLYGVNRNTLFLDNEFSKTNNLFYLNLKEEMDILTEYLTENRNNES